MKNIIESLYTGICDIYEYQKDTDPVSKITKNIETEVCINKKCRVSYKTISSSEQTDTTDNISQVIKLFIDPNLNVKPGSKIIVTQNGRSTSYISSGQPAIYTNHQEIILKLDVKA